MAIALKKVLEGLPTARRQKIDKRADDLIADERTRHSAKQRVARFVVFKGALGEWRWSLVAANGKIVASSGEGYKARKDCLSSIELVKGAAAADVKIDEIV